LRPVLRRLVASVRVRVTATALLAVAAALGFAAVVINADLNHDRQRELTATAQQDARQVVAFNPTLRAPLFLPSDATINSGLIQVIVNGRLIGESRGLHHVPALWHPGKALVAPAPDLVPEAARDIEVVSMPVQSSGVNANVVVVVSLDQFDHTVADVRRVLEIGTPMLLGVVGIICWLIVGRALRPIELMRREVAEVAIVPGGRGHHRVAEPGHDDEVGRLARTLNAMLDRMEASTERERRFVSDASHELRSPIANIRTELEVALHHPEAADWNQVASEVLDQNERMERLVAGLLLLARSDEGSLIEASEPTDLAAVVTGLVADLPEEGPSLVLSAEPSAVRVPAVYAERMVANLIDNARRFASSTVTISVASAEADGRPVARVTVADDGPGVAAADRERIFERFVRLDEARDRDEGGFGLGLAIVADLSRFYGGSIRVGDDGPGAHFVLELPAATAVVASVENLDAGGGAAPGGGFTPSASPPPGPDRAPSY
jgi:signal transduction histidine kinase